MEEGRLTCLGCKNPNPCTRTVQLACHTHRIWKDWWSVHLREHVPTFLAVNAVRRLLPLPLSSRTKQTELCPCWSRAGAPLRRGGCAREVLARDGDCPPGSHQTTGSSLKEAVGYKGMRHLARSARWRPPTDAAGAGGTADPCADHPCRMHRWWIGAQRISAVLFL